MATTAQPQDTFIASSSRGRAPAHWVRRFFVLMGLASIVATTSVSAEEQLTSVTTWQPTMTLQSIDAVLITYTPPLSSTRQYPGANFQSDGTVMVVSLRSCLVHEECPTLEPAKTRAAAGRTRWYEVAVPYRGERVVVEGDGPVKQELAFSPSVRAVAGNSQR